VAVFGSGGLQSIKLAAGLVASLGLSFDPTSSHDLSALGSRGPSLPVRSRHLRSHQPVCVGLVLGFVIVLFNLDPVSLCFFLPISLDICGWKDFSSFLRPVRKLPPGAFSFIVLYKPVAIGTVEVNRIIHSDL
jgi:hypothetical protein